MHLGSQPKLRKRLLRPFRAEQGPPQSMVGQRAILRPVIAINIDLITQGRDHPVPEFERLQNIHERCAQGAVMGVQRHRLLEKDSGLAGLAELVPVQISGFTQ